MSIMAGATMLSACYVMSIMADATNLSARIRPSDSVSAPLFTSWGESPPRTQRHVVSYKDKEGGESLVPLEEQGEHTYLSILSASSTVTPTKFPWNHSSHMSH